MGSVASVREDICHSLYETRHFLGISVEAEKIEAFLETLTLFHFGFSWGGSVSLVMLYDKESGHSRQFANTNPNAGCIARFWLGLEDGVDLETDIFNAWSSIFDA